MERDFKFWKKLNVEICRRTTTKGRGNEKQTVRSKTEKEMGKEISDKPCE
jgi:hypothetical protein